MTSCLPLNKVTAYVTRKDGTDKELLVFQHPTAGLQLPAGTVEEGERPEAAVLREVVEETGLENVKLIRLLSVEETVIPEGQRAVRLSCPLLAEPREDALHLGTLGRSGFLVGSGEMSGTYRQVVHNSYEFDGDGFTPAGSVAGWVLDSNLAQRITRHHFELRAEQVPERWTHTAEGQYDFDLHWLLLRDPVPLVASNIAWLNLVIDKLRS